MVALDAAPGAIEKSRPVPVSVTVCGAPALSVMVSVPVLVPLTVGSKKTPMVQLEFCISGFVQLLRTAKSAGLAVTELMVVTTGVSLVTVSVCGRPLVPTYCPGNVIDEGATIRGTLGKELPVIEMLIG